MVARFTGNHRRANDEIAQQNMIRDSRFVIRRSGRKGQDMDEDEAGYYPENQPRVCECRHCRTLGWEEQGPDCIWFRRAD